MQHLPTKEEQDWLVDALAALIAQHGHQPFLASPILLPTATFFPESRGTAAYVLDRTTRRLLQYAGLSQLDATFSTFVDTGDDDTDSDDPHRATTAAYFAGIENDCCVFGLNAAGSADGEYLAGVMCHEVAHAFRARHGLATTADAEEFLTDVTTVYLGFGVLSTNNTWRYRQFGEAVGNYIVTEWSTASAGYLPPQALTFLLAIQMCVREIPPDRRKQIHDSLEPNQAGFLDRALATLAPERERLVRRLRLPFRARWPAERMPDTFLQPLPEFVPWENDAPPASPDAGRPVFRLERTQSERYGVLGIALGGLILALAMSTGLALPGAGVAGATFVYMVYRGARQRYDICSDPHCHTTLPAAASTCPQCGGSILGRVRDTSEILAAEERLQAEGKWPATFPVDPERELD